MLAAWPKKLVRISSKYNYDLFYSFIHNVPSSKPKIKIIIIIKKISRMQTLWIWNNMEKGAILDVGEMDNLQGHRKTEDQEDSLYFIYSTVLFDSDIYCFRS